MNKADKQPIWDSLWINGQIVTGEGEDKIIKRGGLAILKGHITWIGNMNELDGDLSNRAREIYKLDDKLVTPGLIDCHTHVIYGGCRANEFELRLKGASYAEIAKQGGGILSTVTATRHTHEEDLLESALSRVKSMQAHGATTIEIKSGYGLDLATELKMLRVAKKISELLPVTIVPTFLGAHTIPSEYRSNPDYYVDLVCNEMIPAVANEGLAKAVDVFCETIAFNQSQTERIFKAATAHQLKIKCHAEQLSNSESAALSASYGALSVDHLEFLSSAGIDAMRNAGTVAVLLPSAFYFLREKKLPPIAELQRSGVPIAIATDCNPGTSPNTSMLLTMNMACVLFSLTPYEALLAATKHAAKALGIEDEYGTLTVGKAADFAVWDARSYSELSYYMGYNPLHALIKHGKMIQQ